MTLQPTEQDPQGRQYYAPVVAKVSAISQYPGGGFGFEGIDGFWKPPRENPNMQLIQGESYVLNLTTNRQYKDIRSAEPLTTENTPAGYEARYTPQGDITATPQGQPAATADNFTSGGHFEPPQPKRDATRASIEIQVGVKETGSMLQVLAANGSSELFTPEQVEWLRQMWFDGLYELKHGTPPPAQEGSEDG